MLNEPMNYQREFVIPASPVNPFVQQVPAPTMTFVQPQQQETRDTSGLDILRNSYFQICVC